jgi:glycerol-3-phosphate dehydrogenase
MNRRAVAGGKLEMYRYLAEKSAAQASKASQTIPPQALTPAVSQGSVARSWSWLGAVLVFIGLN